MTVHFICRGNAFRGIIAEAYLNSLHIPGIKVISSGTVAEEHKKANSGNFLKTLQLLDKHKIKDSSKGHYADATTKELIDNSDVIICMNNIVYDDLSNKFALPEDIRIWDITDIGEKDRIANNPEDKERFSEEVFSEIAENVDRLANELKSTSYL